MLITDPIQLQRYASANRMWQGIPSIAVTPGGRLFASFYSGGVTEQPGNFSALLVSDDDGATWSEPIAVADVGDVERAYDSCLWLDPLGRLWYVWSVMPNNRVEFVRCDAPDAPVAELKWSGIRTIGGDVMLNKPIVTRGGEWLFPCAVWKGGLTTGSAGGADGGKTTGAHVFVSRDAGESFAHRGTVVARDRWFDEHMLLEKADGAIAMYIRTTYGIGRALSHDGGATWADDEDSGLGGPNSRFYIGRLASGNVLLVNHYQFKGRNNLAAAISRDDGATFEGWLMLDERRDVSYPDVVERNGVLYIIYDRERGARYHADRDYTNAAREILMARVTEADILAGRLVTPGSRLKMIVSRLERRAQN